MNNNSIAPCGVICDIYLGYLRDKNKCAGCLNTGKKTYHCTVCSIKACAEKIGNEKSLCYECKKFPCRRIKDLDKRYTQKYNESPIKNLLRIKEAGLKQFITDEELKWKCSKCGQLLCVHRAVCLKCGNPNEFFPES